jgi:hypothetical protein
MRSHGRPASSLRCLAQKRGVVGSRQRGRVAEELQLIRVPPAVASAVVPMQDSLNRVATQTTESATSPAIALRASTTQIVAALDTSEGTQPYQHERHVRPILFCRLCKTCMM